MKHRGDRRGVPGWFYGVCGLPGSCPAAAGPGHRADRPSAARQHDPPELHRPGVPVL